MELSLFLVRSWGLFVIVVCLGLLLNKKKFITMLKQMTDDSVLIAGVIALGIGVPSVVGYEQWSFGWVGLVTLLGWVAFIKGILILFIPGYLEKFVKIAVRGNWYAIALTVLLVLGIYMFYVGYFAA